MSGKKEIPTEPDELRADIGQTRGDLGDTVEALAHKADVPARVKESTHERVELVKEKAAEAAAHVVESLPEPVAQRVEQARKNPVVAAAVFATLLLILWKLTRGRS